MQNTFYAIIPHPAEPRILLLPTEGGWAIPTYHPQSSWTPHVLTINTLVKEQLNFNPVVRYTLHVHITRHDDKRYASVLYVLHPPSTQAIEQIHNPQWATLEEYLALPTPDAWPTPHIEAYFAELQSGTVPPLRPPWGRDGWYAAISTWTEEQLAPLNIHLTAPLEQLKQWDISSVLKAPSDQGDIYFKAIPPIFATEPRITEGLARLFPNIVPQPIATYEQPHEGRLLLRDFGGKLLWDPSIEPHAMDDALRLFASMQITCIPLTDHLFSIGCRDRRIQHLPTDLRTLLADDLARAYLTPEELTSLEALIPIVKEATARLLSGPVPQTLLHGDFHAGNISSTPNGLVIFDWTDACICHPFFDLLTIVDSNDEPITPEQREQYLTTYLTAWSEAGYGSLESLRETCDLALSLAPLYHAVSYHNITLNSEQATIAELGSSTPLFLRMLLRLLDKLEH